MEDKLGAGIGIGAGAAVIAALLYFAMAPVEDAEIADTHKPKANKNAAQIAEVKPDLSRPAATPEPSEKRRRDGRPPKMPASPDWYEKLPAKDRELAKRIQDAQDEDNWTNVLFVAEKALESRNDEVREAAVTALSLQGEVAIPLLLKFTADRNENIAESAYRAWDDAVDTIDGDSKKATVIRDALMVLKSNEQIKTAVGKMEMFEQGNAMRELAKIAKGSGPAAEAARETYESVAGEPFYTEAAAGVKAILLENADKLP